MKVFGLAVVALAAITGCSDKKKDLGSRSAVSVEVPTFNADSSYHFVESQVTFGPRVPGTEAHRQTAAFLAATLQRFGADVALQTFEAFAFDGTKLQLTNIIGSFHSDRPRRVLLAAHWDTRLFADKDKEHRNAPLDGANDGASGVGVLLEVARAINRKAPPNVGVDIVFFDGEDWGEKDGEEAVDPAAGYQSWWCLGSQFWATHKHKPGYSAAYGILLDMVGAKNAHFFREEVSMKMAPSIVDKVWRAAERAGYSDYFVAQDAPGITDDHVFVNRLGKIQMIDVVPYSPSSGFFGDFHHTTLDNLQIIDKQTLKAVGQTVLLVVYSE